MASVKFELRNEGKGLHEWDYIPLCESRIVRMQIQNRSQQDRTYNMKLYDSSPLISQGVAPMSEPITVTYLDLDRQIDTCGLTDDESRVVELMMQGYIPKDIREMTDLPVRELFDSAVDKIIDQNEYEWHRCQTARRIAGYQ